MKKIVLTSRNCVFLASFSLSCLGFGGAVAAQTATSPKKPAKKTKAHTTKLTLGATGAANSSSNVVGAVNGTTMQIGVLLQGSHKYNSGKHSLVSELKVQHAQTKTPVLDTFVKSTDVFELQSTWLHRTSAGGTVGPFGRFKLASQLLGSVDVRPDSVTVERVAIDGSKTSKKVNAEVATPTTNPFEPLLLNETLGFYAHPIAEKMLTLKLKAGAGAQQIVASGGYALAGYDDDTKTVTLKELESSVQAGGELELQANGALSETVVWTAKANFFQPLYSNASASFEGLDALQTDVAASLSVKLSSWAKLDYVVNVRRIPLVIDMWQVQHGLLLTTGFNLL